MERQLAPRISWRANRRSSDLSRLSAHHLSRKACSTPISSNSSRRCSSLCISRNHRRFMSTTRRTAHSITRGARPLPAWHPLNTTAGIKRLHNRFPAFTSGTLALLILTTALRLFLTLQILRMFVWCPMPACALGLEWSVQGHAVSE